MKTYKNNETNDALEHLRAILADDESCDNLREAVGDLVNGLDQYAAAAIISDLSSEFSRGVDVGTLHRWENPNDLERDILNFTRSLVCELLATAARKGNDNHGR